MPRFGKFCNDGVGGEIHARFVARIYPEIISRNFIARFLRGKFYLHQFSKQLLDDGLDEVGEPLIYYRALRDERDKKHKIKLEAVNDALLNDFINKYEQEY